MFSHPKILFLVSLLFVALLNSIPTYFFEFLNFLIILVCLLFIHAKHYYNTNFSAGTQNVTGAYISLYGKAAVSYQITLEKQQKLFVKEVRDVIKYT